MSDETLSVLIVTYNNEDWIERCLNALESGLEGLAADLVVVDNASADSSVDVLRRLRPSATLVVNTDNAGFAAAVNQAARAACGDWLLLLNPDTECRPGAIRALLDFALAHPGHGLYGGRTLNPDGSVQPGSCWALPTLWSTACFAFGLSTAFPRSTIFDPESMGRWQRDTVREVGMVTGCLLLVHRDVWVELGGLNERYFVYGEDADFAARARALGYRPIITPEAELVHALGASSSPGAKTVLLMAGKLTYVQEHFGRAAPLGGALLRLGVAIRAGAGRLTGRRVKWAEAWDERARWWHGFPEDGHARDVNDRI